VDTFASTRIDTNVSSFVIKKGGKQVMSGQVVVSKDGRSKTVTLKEKNEKGQDVTVVMVYDKQ
jgi:hypothetical protein